MFKEQSEDVECEMSVIRQREGMDDRVVLYNSKSYGEKRCEDAEDSS